jgi:CubicO group peptidase (beta-lactamase class C family)
MVWLIGSHGALPRADLVKKLRYLEMSHGLRETWQYNNLVYMAVGYVIEVVTGMTWEEAVAAHILEPLGMTNTNFFIEEMQKSDDVSLPYAEIDGKVIDVPFRGIESVGPAGSMNSCLDDMTRWLAFNVSAGAHEGKQIVTESSIKELQWPAIAMPQGVDQWDEVRTIAYGMGWVIQDFRGQRGAWHNGGVDGFKTLVSFLPAAKTGVVILANRFPTEFPEALSYRIFEELLDLESAPWGERFYEFTESAAEAAKQEREKQLSRSKDGPPTHPLGDFVGTYTHPAYGRITFEVRDEELSVDLPGLDLILSHRHYDIWEGTERVHGFLLPFSFHMDLDGEIDAVEAKLEDAVAPIVFEKEPAPSPSEPETPDA